ncbi:MAG: phosphomannomutase/phosphoglucomutase [Patescibacteria group bacterium]
MNPSVFKAYDIRGIVDQDITSEDAFAIGRAFATYLARILKKKCKDLRIVIGKDNRVSSHHLYMKVTEGLLMQGVTILDIDIGPTPLFYFAVSDSKADGGIMITASHNPPKYNGFKLVGQRATPIGLESGLKDIQKLMESGDYEFMEARGTVAQEEVLQAYTAKTLEYFPLPDAPDMRIVVDAGNGVASIICKSLFKQTTMQIFPLFFEMDGSFPNHMPNPLDERNIIKLKEEMVAQEAHLGIALDADADRIVFVDEKGAIIPPDLITSLIADVLLRAHPGSAHCYDVRSSRAVKETIERAGGTAIVSRVGHAYIKQLMREKDILFAGELSGHYYFHIDDSFFEWPLIAMNIVLSEMLRTGKKASELASPYRTYVKTKELNYSIEKKEETLAVVEKHFADAKTLSHLDGLTAEYDDWWFNLRTSNTENVVRLNLEAREPQLLEDKLTEVLAAMGNPEKV